jgi:hypothetical protein
MIDAYFLAILKVRQFAIWDCPIATLLHFLKTLRAKCYTVTNPLIPAFCYRYSGNSIPSTCNIPPFKNSEERYSTPSTRSVNVALGVPLALSVKSSKCNSPHKLSSNEFGHSPPPLKRWEKCTDNYWYTINGLETGIHIVKVARLWLSMSKFAPPLKLPHPIFRISFTPPSEDYAIMEICQPTLREAKKLAEWYYQEWSKVNHNFDTQSQNSYPLAKRLEVGHDRVLGTRRMACRMGAN